MDAYKKHLSGLRNIFILLTTLIIFLQFYFLTHKLPTNIAFSNKTMGFYAIFLEKLTHHFSLWVPLILFIITHILLQVILAVLIFYTAKNFAHLSNTFKKNIFLVGVIFWLLCQITIFLWNWYLYPYSFFSINLAKLGHPFLLNILLYLSTILVAIVLIYVILRLFILKPIITTSIILFILLLLLGLYFFPRFSSHYYFSKTKAPNVILIIADSLRPDYANGANKKTSFVQTFIKQSAFFPNSFSLLGRSTPGWSTIFTGNYPKNNGARFNLIPNHHLQLENSLMAILKSSGYQTILAADSLQFVNLNNQFNFDQIISPTPGIYDYLFTIFNDTPLTNLIMNTFLGELIFPYNYANRSSYFLYMPKSFIHLVDRQLKNKDKNKPALLVFSLAIAHWPYVWARQPYYDNLTERYDDCFLELDKQIHSLTHLLEKRGLLQNSIIVTLSDHGDSLGLPGDRVINEKYYLGNKERLNLIMRSPYMAGAQHGKLLGIDTALGHGTDLLSLTQLQTTLAFRQKNVISPKTFFDRVALIDVTPTLLDLLNIHTNVKFDGMSLKPLILGTGKIEDLNRPLFLESEIDIPLIDVTKQSESVSTLIRLVNEYATLYDIDPKTRLLFLKETAVARLLKEKQRGIIFGDWLLVYFPGKNQMQTSVLPANSPELTQCYYSFPATKTKSGVTQLFCYRLSPTKPYYVLVNLQTKKWEILLPGEKNNPVFTMLYEKLKQFYGNELVD